MSGIGIYRVALERHEYEQWRKGVGCFRWPIDDRRPEPDYVSKYFEAKERVYPQDDVQVNLPPEATRSAVKKSISFKSNRKGFTSRFLKSKS